MNQNLTNLLRKKQQQSKVGGAVDWDDRRDKYLQAVRDLYQQIETILAEPIHQKTITILRRPKQLAENFIGTYAVEDLILGIGNEQVRFSPRGRTTAGAAGRVDVLGERAEAMLIARPDAKWEFVQARQPTLRTVPLDDATLTEVLQIVMRE